MTIKVGDEDEAPTIMEGGLAISGMARVDYAENDTRMVATYTATGPDAASAAWTLEGDDAGDFMISAGMLTFMGAPDYEAPADAGTDNTYMVTVKADDGTYMDTHDVTVMVTNVDEPGTVTLSPTAPVVGTAITATLADPDSPDGVTGATWQWARSMEMDGTFTKIEEATLMAYTPVKGDATYYLKVTAMYTDGHGSGKSEMATTANMVTAGNPLVAKYDANNNGGIDLNEVFTAIDDYFDYDDRITLEEVYELVDLYFDN